LEPGKILVARSGGNYLIKLMGYVRMTLCASLHEYIEGIFNTSKDNAGKEPDLVEKPVNVLVDLYDTEGLDSTTLGLLAKLAIHCQEQFGLKPLLFCARPGIIRELEVMAIDDYFQIITRPCRESCDQTLLHELPEVDIEPELISDQVLEAHKLLIKINPASKNEFIDLIRILERKSVHP